MTKRRDGDHCSNRQQTDRKARECEIPTIFADGLSINPGPSHPPLSSPFFSSSVCCSQRRKRTRIKEPPRKSDFLSRCTSCRKFLRERTLLKNGHELIFFRSLRHVPSSFVEDEFRFCCAPSRAVAPLLRFSHFKARDRAK